MKADARLSAPRSPGRNGPEPIGSIRIDNENVYASLDGGLDPLSKWDKKVWFIMEGLTKSFQSRFSDTKKLPRIVGSISRAILRDGDGDGLVTNMVTGVDDMPIDEIVDIIRDRPAALAQMSERIGARMTAHIGKRPRKNSNPKRRKKETDKLVSFIKEQAKMVLEKDSSSVLNELSQRDMGFTISPTSGSKYKEGYAVARPGRGLRILASAFYDDNGNPTDAGVDALMLVVMANIDEISEPQDGASNVALGGWHSPKKHDINGNLLGEDGLPVDDPRDAAECESNDKDCITFIYLDVTDIFDEDSKTEKEMYDIGNKRNQQSIAKLSAINDNNYESANVENMVEQKGKWAFLDTGGTGMTVLDEEATSTVAAEVLEGLQVEQ